MQTALLIVIALFLVDIYLLLAKNIKQMKALIDALTANVAKLTAVDTSVKALLTGLKTSLDDEIKKLADAGADTAAIQALSDEVGTSADDLAAAVTANTPKA